VRSRLWNKITEDSPQASWRARLASNAMTRKMVLRSVVAGLGIGVLSLVSVYCSGQGQPDDVLVLPGGLAYNADVGKDGWPVSATSFFGQETVEFRPPSNVVTITYRQDIETRVGQSVKIIFYVFTLIVHYPTEVRIEPLGLPDGITSQIMERWRDSHPGRSDDALEIRVSRRVATGEYTFEFNVTVNGEYCGRLPCMIKVVE
jgi:hypothetical protein